MRVVNWRLVIIGLIIVLAISAGLFLWRTTFLPDSQVIEPKPEPEEFFEFSQPTEAELEAIGYNEEDFAEDLTSVAIEKPIPVYQCPEADCPVLRELEAGTELFFKTSDLEAEPEWLPQDEGFIKTADLLAALQPAPELPDTALDLADLPLEPAQPVAINPQTIVGIACEFKNADGFEKITRGSGAIISAEGHILTSRSSVDLDFLNDGFNDFQLKNCLVGQIPSDRPLPSTEAIRQINAFIRLPFLSYTAELVYTPKQPEPEEEIEGEENQPTKKLLSDYEEAWLDFAILKINGLNPDVRFFGVTEMPKEFPFAPILISDLPKKGAEVLSFGFPSGTTVGHRVDIRTIFLQGLISRVTNFWSGDQRYLDDLFIVEADLVTEDTAGGRFGSPIFWKGYLVAVHIIKQRQSLQTFNVSAKAILENLYDARIPIPIELH